MLFTILGILAALLIPVAIVWRVAFKLLMRDPTPSVKLFFWSMSAVFIVLAGVLCIVIQYLD